MRNSSKNIIWTIFKIEREVSGNYKPCNGVDTIWLKRQKTKLSKTTVDVIFVVADLFVELVYDCRTSKVFKKGFLDTLNSKLREIPNFKNAVMESELVKRYWSIEKYMRQFNIEKLFTGELKRSELKNRSLMYNPKSLKINNEELKEQVVKAKSLFRVEEKLLSLVKIFN